jgi:hypothetical protein
LKKDNHKPLHKDQN